MKKVTVIITLLVVFFTIEAISQKKISVEMIKVEGGTFMMGTHNLESVDEVYDSTIADSLFDEKPVHQVTVNSFYIGKTEVTQEQWNSVMGSDPSYSKGDKKPVEQVSWYDVIEFCNKLSEKEGLKKAYTINKKKKDPNNNSEYDELKWLINCDFNSNGYRLPTEAEWEYAARGGNKSKGYEYSGSNDIEAVAWYDSNSGSKTHEAGRKSPNELGIYDMSGNVFEWCWDWKGDYQSVSQTNPRGAGAGSARVLRGGSYNYYAVYCRVACRYTFINDYRYLIQGFRLVRTK